MSTVTLNMLIAKIEQEKTDAMGKLYLYSALLHVCASQDETAFLKLLPGRKPRGLFKSLNNDQLFLNVGSLHISFVESIHQYREQFRSKQGYPLAVARTIFSAFFRQGKLADLCIMIDKMVEHLNQMNAGQLEKNQAIYDFIDFKQAHEPIAKELQQIQSMQSDVLNVIDQSGYALIASGVALTGLTLMVFSGLAWVPLFLGTAILAAGGAGAYLAVTNVLQSLDHLKTGNAESLQTNESVSELARVICDRPEQQAVYYRLIIKAALYSLPAMCQSLSQNEDMPYASGCFAGVC